MRGSQSLSLNFLSPKDKFLLYGKRAYEVIAALSITADYHRTMSREQLVIPVKRFIPWRSLLLLIRENQ